MKLQMRACASRVMFEQRRSHYSTPLLIRMLHSKAWFLKLSALSFLLSATALPLKAVADIGDGGLEITLPREVNRIIETRTCESCTIVVADLSEADLSAALFKGSRFVEAYFVDTTLVEADLSDAWIQSTNMTGTDLRQANLQNAYLDLVWLNGADLTDVDLSSARINDGYFRNANLSGADLMNTQIRSSDFTGADLTQTDFTNANIVFAYFVNTDLRNAELRQATFEEVIYDTRTQFPEGFLIPESGTYLFAPHSSVAGIRAGSLALSEQDLTGLDISHAQIGGDFSRAVLNEANFENTNANHSDLIEASLVDARFCNAQLVGINLTDANLEGADIRGADLRRAVVDGTNFQGAIYNVDTQFPEGFAPAAAGAVFDEASADCPPLE
ncbi:MAG: pentapeptide repeat-containing protein [Leptolyngbyaceae cyanobacterium]